MRSMTPMRARDRRSAGFTLIEIMVVLSIIAIVMGGALLSLGLVGNRDAPPAELERLSALIIDLRDRAELENRDYGVQVTTAGYRFLVFDSRTMRWTEVDERRFSKGEWPTAATLELDVEGRRIVLGRRPFTPGELGPDFGVDSTGEYTAFELRIGVDSSQKPWRLGPDENGDLALRRAAR